MDGIAGCRLPTIPEMDHSPRRIGLFKKPAARQGSSFGSDPVFNFAFVIYENFHQAEQKIFPRVVTLVRLAAKVRGEAVWIFAIDRLYYLVMETERIDDAKYF